MVYRSILAAASGGTASEATVELACRLVQRFEAQLEICHAKISPQELALASTDGFGLSGQGDWIDRTLAEADEAAAQIRQAADTALRCHGLPALDHPNPGLPSCRWREESGSASVLVPLRARFFDLVILGRSERVIDNPASTTIEETLLQSGRPVLLAPTEPPPAIGCQVTIGWDGSTASVRALAASMPFLAAADAVRVLTIGNDAAADLPAVAAHLAAHGIAARTEHVQEAEPILGLQLLADAGRAGADLLVMGGYGHSAWREWLLGGATRTVIGASSLPVLLMH
jgi:nucleotide-binding universal stress UspA family protein